MKKFFYVFIPIFAITLALPGCQKKQEPQVIVVHKPKSEKPRGIQSTGNYSQTMDMPWIGKKYKVETSRKADKSVNPVGEGNHRYYNNTIRIRVIRPDNTVFFDRTFTKADFQPYLDNAYLKRSVLLGIVPTEAQGDYLFLAASVGAPDALSDDFVPFTVKLSRMGDVSITRSSTIDEPSEGEGDEDGV